MLALTKEQFRKQFKFGPVSFKGIQPLYEETVHGYEIHRCLQLIFLKDENGKFWCSRLS